MSASANFSTWDNVVHQEGCNDLLLRVDDLTNAMLTKVGVIAVHVVAEKRSTLSRANVLSEVL